MNAKEYLGQAFYMSRQIKTKQRKLDWLRDLAPGPGVRFSDEPKAPGDPRSSVVENAAIRVRALEEEIASDIMTLVGLLKEIEATIRAVDSLEYRTVLEMRYLSFMDWEEITARMGYSKRYVFIIHRRALQAVHVPG